DLRGPTDQRTHRRALPGPAPARSCPAIARVGGVPAPDPHQLHARLQGQRLLLALRLRDLARGGRDARAPCGELLDRVDAELRLSRRTDGDARFAPDLRAEPGRDPGGQP